jgi:hypothetical protein
MRMGGWVFLTKLVIHFFVRSKANPAVLHLFRMDLVSKITDTISLRILFIRISKTPKGFRMFGRFFTRG